MQSLELEDLHAIRERMKKCAAAFSRDHVLSINATAGVLAEWVNRICVEATSRSWLHGDAGILECLTPQHVMEIAMLRRPPTIICAVLSNVHTIIGLETDWTTVQQRARHPKTFLERLKYLNQVKVTDDTLRTLHLSFRSCPEAFDPFTVSKVSRPCGVLCKWVNAVSKRAGVSQPTIPKKVDNFSKWSRGTYLQHGKGEQTRLEPGSLDVIASAPIALRPTPTPASVSQPRLGVSPRRYASPSRSVSPVSMETHINMKRYTMR